MFSRQSSKVQIFEAVALIMFNHISNVGVLLAVELLQKSL